MLRVKTFIAISPGIGLGLFAAQHIPIGTVTWRYDPKIDYTVAPDAFDRLDELTKAFLIKFAYFDHALDRYILPLDDQRFINHSEKLFNIRSQTDIDVAWHEIKHGEELLCDYRHFEIDYFERRGIDPSGWV